MFGIHAHYAGSISSSKVKSFCNI